MMMLKKYFVVCAVCLAVCAAPFFPQGTHVSAAGFENFVSNSRNAEVFADALNAYKNADWKTAVFLFKKLQSVSGELPPDALYMLIMAQTNNSQYKQAADDCDVFMKKFPDSRYVPLVMYQKGKNLYYAGDYEKSVIALSDFCHTYPSHELYASSLFFIAESFYAVYNFENAKPLYERIAAEYPDDSKAKSALYRLDVIAQRSREEKLLYLLKQTGEDYLASKESYEKALKQYKVESSVGINEQIRELRQQNESLDVDLANEKRRAQLLEEQIKAYEDDLAESIRLLKMQADEASELLDESESLNESKSQGM